MPRQPKRFPRAILTAQDREDMRDRLDTDCGTFTLSEIAEEFKCSIMQVAGVKAAMTREAKNAKPEPEVSYVYGDRLVTKTDGEITSDATEVDVQDQDGNTVGAAIVIDLGIDDLLEQICDLAEDLKRQGKL